MVGITFTPPLLPSQSAGLLAPEQPQLQIAAVYRTDGTAIPLVTALHDASGPGNVITGRITSQQSDGTITLETPGGIDLTLHHPPEISLNVGSTVTLRVVNNDATPQVLLLAIDGKLVNLRSLQQQQALLQTPDPAPRAPQASPSPFFAQAPPTSRTQAGPTSLLSLLDEAALIALLDGETAAIAAPNLGTEDTTARIATLIRPAPARPGHPPIPVGTRYIVILDAHPIVDDFSTTASLIRPGAPLVTGGSGRGGPAELIPPTTTPVQPAASVIAAGQDGTPPSLVKVDTVVLPISGPQTNPGTGASVPPLSPGDPIDDAIPALGLRIQDPNTQDAFIRQSVTLAGRTIQSDHRGTLLIETSLGLLSLDLGDSASPRTDIAAAPLPGTALRLHIAAVAPPRPGAPTLDNPEPQIEKNQSIPLRTTTAGDRSVGTSPIDAAIMALSTLHQPMLETLSTQMVLPPGDGFITAFIGMLFSLKPTPRGTPLDPSVRQALTGVGKKDLADQLDDISGEIGSSRPARTAPDMTVTILPYLGTLTTEPMRLYRPIAPTDGDGKKRHRDSEHFVIELTLKRLGPLQFDGLVRDRRFDLTLRSVTPLPEILKSGIEQCFFSTLNSQGWAGGLAFGRASRFPLFTPMPPPARTGGGVAV